MKTLKTLLVVTATTFTLFYLTGCLAQASFNIAKWSEDARGITFSLALVTVLITMVAKEIKGLDNKR